MRFNQDIGIDLGTANVLVHVRGRGIIMREPSVVAMEVGKARVREVGEKAREMLGRTPVNIVAIRPMTDGVIADYTTTQKLLEYIFHRICGVKRVFKPRVLLAVPSSATSVEKRAVKQAALAAGAGEALTIEEPMAAALGAGLPISAPGGNMVVDIGGGTTDIAVLSLDGIVLSRSLRIGGMKLDEVITRHVRGAYNLMIGDRTAEEIKITIGSAAPMAQETKMEVRGRGPHHGPAADRFRDLPGDPGLHGRADQPGGGPGQERPRKDAAGAGVGHHRARHRPHRRLGPAARPGTR